MFSFFGTDTKNKTASNVVGNVTFDPVNSKLDEAMSSIATVKAELASLKSGINNSSGNAAPAAGGGKRRRHKTRRHKRKSNRRRRSIGRK